MKYRLGSSSFVNAAGLFKWAQNGYHFKKDRKSLCFIITETWGIPEHVAHGALMGKIPVVFDGEEVIIDTGENDAPNV